MSGKVVVEVFNSFTPPPIAVLTRPRGASGGARSAADPRRNGAVFDAEARLFGK